MGSAARWQHRGRPLPPGPAPPHTWTGSAAPRPTVAAPSARARAWTAAPRPASTIGPRSMARSPGTLVEADGRPDDPIPLDVPIPSLAIRQGNAHAATAPTAAADVRAGFRQCPWWGSNPRSSD